MVVALGCPQAFLAFPACSLTPAPAGGPPIRHATSPYSLHRTSEITRCKLLFLDKKGQVGQVARQSGSNSGQRERNIRNDASCRLKKVELRGPESFLPVLPPVSSEALRHRHRNSGAKRGVRIAASSDPPGPLSGEAFDLDLAVLLAGFSFESYNTPPQSAVSVTTEDAVGCRTLFLAPKGR